MMTELYRTSRPFAAKLWRVYPASPTLIYQLGLCAHMPESLEAWLSRVRHLSALMTPGSLLAASERLSPANGRRRDPEAVAFDEEVLQRLDHAGRWRW
jgi:hypothetical protein